MYNLYNKKGYNKKGQSTILMIIFLVVLLLGLILLFVGGVTTIKINEALSLDLDLGQVNLKEYNELTFGKFADMYLSNADWWGICLIFGMVMGLFLSAYFTRNSFPKWGIIFDIIIIVAIFITSLYFSSAYASTLDALATAGETFLEDYVPKSSMFMLNLPVFVVIIGVVMMILFHSSIPSRKEEGTIRGGSLRGI